MPRTWVLWSITLAGLLIVMTGGAILEAREVFSPQLAAVSVATVAAGLLGFLLFRLYPYPTVLPAPSTSTTAGVQRYLRWLIREVADYRFMLGTALPERAGIVFSEVFCDINVYGFNHRRLSLSRWLSETKIGKERYGALLLGPPGSGKSVTLQAILLSCANSAYLSSILSSRAVAAWSARQFLPGSQSPTRAFRLLFDATWTVPAPPLVPILVRLGTYEHYFERYLQLVDKDIERDLLIPILNNIPELGPERFRSLMEAGRLALLFDGLDELPNEAWRIVALELVNFLWLRGGEHPNLFIVTCRTGSFSTPLRDTKPRGFGEIMLEHLTAEDKRAIVTKLIETELRSISNRTNSLLSGVNERLEALITSDNKINTYKLSRADLIGDLVSEIVDRVPQAYSSWKPADYPLSLRRMTTVLLARPREHLQVRWEPGDERPRWILDVGHFRDSVLDYTNIIEEDLREFINRRSLFSEVNGYPRDEMLKLYGEVAYELSSGSDSIPEQKLRLFVAQNTSSTQLTTEQSFQAFCAPGIISEIGSYGPAKRFAFRDIESAEFLSAFFMVTSRDPECKIDNFLARNDDFIATPPPCLAMAFARLKGDALREYVRRTKYFSHPSILTSLVAGLVGSTSFGAISEREAEVLVERCIAELEKPTTTNHLRVWQLLRHIIFHRQCYPDWTPSRCLEFLQNSDAPPESIAQMLLVFAEFSYCFLGDRWVEDAITSARRYIENKELLLRSCAVLALDYLGYAEVPADKSEEALWASAVGGNYLLGDSLIQDNPQRNTYIEPFRIARFPVLRFQFADQRGERTPPGDAFKPVVGITAAEASEFARLMGARLPTSAEFEIIASYHGEQGNRRIYPWGNDFSPFHVDVALERSNLRAILRDSDESSPVGMKPCLATPGGVFDLVSNVWQLTADRSPLEHEEPEVIMFGPPLLCDDQDLFRCVDRSPVPVDRIPKRVGFRLAKASE